MDNIRIFESEKFGKIRTINREDGPWFIAADVCRALEVANNRDALSRLDDDEKDVASTDTPGGNQQMSIISEPGLYALVLSSRKPEARAFKRWITHEVIPALRKTGRYSTHNDSYEDLINKLRQDPFKEQTEAFAASLGAKVNIAPQSRQKPLTPESAARILSGVRLAEALPLVRAALVEAGVNLPEIELIPDGLAKRKYTVRVKHPELDLEALANAIGKALAHQMLNARDIAEMADLPQRHIENWTLGLYVPTDEALARLNATLRERHPNLFN